MLVATAPLSGTALGRSAQTATQKSHAPTRVLAPTPRCIESRVLGARRSAFSAVMRGTSCLSSFIDSLSREADTRAAASSLPFSSFALSMCIW